MTFYRLNSLQQLQILCLRLVTNTTREKGLGIAVLPASVFFSIDYRSLKVLFDEARSDEIVNGVKVWCALIEQDEQTGENYCGIDIGVRTADREIMSAGVLEMWTRILMFLCQDVLSQIPHI